jgi:FlaA1/EpsC-like NDP-sugar epimerase
VSYSRGYPAEAARSAGHAAVWLARRIRGRSLLVIDLVGIAGAAYLALALRFDQITAPALVPEFPFLLLLLLVVRTATNVGMGLYSRRWRYASTPELERIVIAVVLGSLLSIAIFHGFALVAGGSWAEGSSCCSAWRSLVVSGSASV